MTAEGGDENLNTDSDSLVAFIMPNTDKYMKDALTPHADILPQGLLEINLHLREMPVVQNLLEISEAEVGLLNVSAK